jgi:hypothetical protein
MLESSISTCLLLINCLLWFYGRLHKFVAKKKKTRREINLETSNTENFFVIKDPRGPRRAKIATKLPFNDHNNLKCQHSACTKRQPRLFCFSFYIFIAIKIIIRKARRPEPEAESKNKPLRSLRLARRRNNSLQRLLLVLMARENRFEYFTTRNKCRRRLKFAIRVDGFLINSFG